MTKVSNTKDEEQDWKYVEHFLNTYEDAYAENTLNGYRTLLRLFVNFLHNRNRTIPDVTLRHIDPEYVLHCIQRKNRENTIWNKIYSIKRFYQHLKLYRDELEVDLSIELIDFTRIQLSRYRKQILEDFQREALSKDEIRALYESADCKRDELIMRVLYEGALRNTELRNLKVDDIDLQEGVIHFHDVKGGYPRMAILSNELSARLKHWIREDRQGWAAADYSPYLFVTNRSEKIDISKLSDIVVNAASDAGIQEVQGYIYHKNGNQRRKFHRVTPHVFRHTAITHWENAGIPQRFRQLIAGHKDPKTHERYTHSDSLPLLKKAWDKFNPA